ncbi:hypothetical protein P154DRAFT_526366 [Amniculicola lignicola CBS 123094]|uniref:Uncharacterized protein n=1 Tax=Amniculicola lignicola CBS 123094 TaxID=1392246 RepID=A0A6A5WCT2_9PLEO|nr:hypothetical protein P154DRAFT_526366 [Amniculicola lignicola CBS 123094]
MSSHSANALVESVRCRRIRLARKKISCNRKLSREEAIIEATLSSLESRNSRVDLRQARCDILTGDTSYHANIDAILAWLRRLSNGWICSYSRFHKVGVTTAEKDVLSNTIPCMLRTDPELRPSAERLVEYL